MTLAVSDLKAQAFSRRLPLVLSLALREQRNGLKCFYVFIACVALDLSAFWAAALSDAAATDAADPLAGFRDRFRFLRV